MKTGILKTGQPVKILETFEEYLQAELELHENFQRLTVEQGTVYQITEEQKEKLTLFFKNVWEHIPPNNTMIIFEETVRPFRPHIINIGREELLTT